MAAAETLAKSADEYGATAYHVKEGTQGVSLKVEDFSLWYGTNRALWDNNLEVQKGLCTALIGPSV
jgi:phosphate transport system ATP-binding protein